MSKKLLLLSTVLSGMLSTQICASDESVETITKSQRINIEPFAGRITGSKVRLRTHPSLEGHVVREVTSGELFAIMGEENEFYAIVPTKGTKGYVFRTFILDGVVEGDRVNVRLYPDTDAPIVAQLNTGDKVETIVSDINNKWLEIDLPATSRFFIAKEYVERKGSVEMIAQMEKRQHEGMHHLSSALLFAQAEIQKPFEQIDLDSICHKLDVLIKEYAEIPDIASRALEAHSLMQDLYVQKKIAFLDKKIEKDTKPFKIDPLLQERLAKLGIELKQAPVEKNVVDIGEAASSTMGLVTSLGEEEITDKMLVWQPLEESLYHLWAAARGECSMEEFYEQEESNATVLTGFIEPYNRPVKNRPGDFILKSEHLPVAFLYSTKINLEKLVGKKVSVVGAPRPNNHFAFPAYYVLGIE